MKRDGCLQMLLVLVTALLFAGCPNEDDDDDWRDAPGPQQWRCIASKKPAGCDGAPFCEKGHWVCPCSGGASCVLPDIGCKQGSLPKCENKRWTCRIPTVEQVQEMKAGCLPKE